MSATVFTIEAAKAANIAVIENGRGTQAVHEAIVAMRAARRSGTASTKTKAEVSGSGSKPWRQKGTGRARAGYKSSPVWSGGGVAFGPKPRDYTKNVPKSVRRLAFRKALSSKIALGDVLIVDSFSVAEPKTKQFVSLLGEQTPEVKTLVIALAFDENTYKAARNVSSALLNTATDVNTEQLLAFRKIIIVKDALEKLAERAA
ncbi:MAG TPA: 50S ribosomal protein L4 [Chthoniobacterales bacterium]|jgi:large subunit ribosomal protein L4